MKAEAMLTRAAHKITGKHWLQLEPGKLYWNLSEQGRSNPGNARFSKILSLMAFSRLGEGCLVLLRRLELRCQSLHPR
jgi:hypothetical protein